MLTLLLALLLSGPTTARAQDNPQTSTFDPADTDGDGVVSGKERRTARRAERRARRGQRGPNGELLSDEDLDAAEAEESSARGQAASSRASAAASALKNSLPSADAGAGIPGGGAAATSPAGSQTSGGVTSASVERSASLPANSSQKATGDPGRPQSASDFRLAARSGYAPAFASAGLKLGPDGKSILRLDGKPATPADYARLKREIASMPSALSRRPDFFSAISPAHYADLKRGYKEKKDDDQVYKDVGLTEEDRDFVHTASCSKLSGDCNKNAEKASYKKGDFVSPEDLDNMWDALQKELDGSAEEGGGLPSLSSARAKIIQERAVNAARALSGGGGGNDGSVAGTPGEVPLAERTVVSRAVASVRKIWKNASTMPLPGSTGAQGDNSLPILVTGALALAAVIGGALFLRRKG